MKMIIQPQGGCVICFREIHKTGATALRLKDPITPLPQGSGVTRQPWASSLSPVGAKEAAKTSEFSRSLGSDRILHSIVVTFS